MERTPRGGNGNPLQYSYLESSMGRGTWQGYSPWDCKESDKTNVTERHTRTLELFSSSSREVDPHARIYKYKRKSKERIVKYLKSAL